MFKKFRLFSIDEAREIASRLTDWNEGQALNVTGTIKQNQEIVAGEGHDNYPDAQRVQQALIASHSVMEQTLLYRMTIPKFNRYGVGDVYKRHFDASPMTIPEMRTDFSFTVALNDDYEGGELTIETPEGNYSVSLSPGECVIYECGNAHWVTPVTRGERICAIGWMRSLVRDPRQRRLLADFRTLLGRWENEQLTPEAYGEIFTSLTGVQTELCRMWIDA